MSLAEDYHAAHKARLSRMGGPKPAPAIIAKPRPSIKPQAIDAGWDVMWFHDLITGHSKEPKAIPIRDIQEAACRHYDISIMDMLSARKSHKIVYARQIAFYLCRIFTPHSFAEIGRRFGGKDHTTVIHGTQKIEGLYGDDLKVTCDVNTIKKVLA